MERRGIYALTHNLWENPRIEQFRLNRGSTTSTFILTSGSPAIGAGTTYSALPTTDFYGTTTSKSSAWSEELNHKALREAVIPQLPCKVGSR